MVRVLEVAAGSAGLLQRVDGLPRFEPVARLCVDRHGNVDSVGDAGGGGEHLVGRRAFVILEAERRGDPAARGRDDREARIDDRLRRGDVPCVRKHERAPGHVQRPEKLAMGLEAHSSTTWRTTLPPLRSPIVRSKALRLSDSGKTASIVGRSLPTSTSLARSTSCSRLGSTTKYVELIPGVRGGSSATDTSRPPGRTTAGARSSRSPPTVSNTTSTGSKTSGIAVKTSSAPSSRTLSLFPADVVPIT